MFNHARAVRCLKFFVVFPLIFVTLFIADHTHKSFDAEKEYHLTEPALYGLLSSSSLQFEKNAGQVDDEVEFFSRGRGYNLYLMASSAQLALQPDDQFHDDQAIAHRKDLIMNFVGSNPQSAISGVNEAKCKSHYLIGNDPTKWQTNIANFERVKYKDIYPGIDLVFYGKQGALEYDFIVSPGVDPALIEIEIDNAEDVQIDNSGNLKIVTGGEAVEFKAPVIYQQEDNFHSSIDGHFCLNDDNIVAFDVGPYDSSLPLVIDPELVYSTYLGGSAEDDYGYDIAVDDEGSIYVTGKTASDYFPTTSGAFQRELKHSGQWYGGNADAFVTKFNPEGSALIYSTYFGGAGDDEGRGIAVDGEGCAHITGITWSSAIPVKNAVQAKSPGGGDVNPETYRLSGDGFVVKFDPTGSDLVYSTFLGSCEGTDLGTDIALDHEGNAYVTGYTHFGRITDAWKQEFPTTPGSYNPKPPYGSDNAFVAKFKPDGTLAYSTVLRNGDDYFNIGTGIAVDRHGNACVTGIGKFSATNGAYNYSPDGPAILVAKLNSSGSGLIYNARLGPVGGWFWLMHESYEGGPGDVAVDADGNAFVTGRTTEGFPTTAGAIRTEAQNGDFFLAKLNESGSTLLYSTLIKGHRDVQGGGFAGAAQSVRNYTEGGLAIDSEGHAYITGAIDNAAGFPIKDAVQDSFGGNWDAFVIKIDPSPASPSPVIYSTFLGGNGDDYGLGIAVDGNGNAYITGQTNSRDFPTTDKAHQKSLAGSWDAFVARIGRASTSLIFDQVMRGDLPIAPPLAPPATQQIVQQFRMTGASDTLFFSFEGRSSDGMAGLRLSNSRAVAPFPLKLGAKVLDPDNSDVGFFLLPNIHTDNFGARFNVNKDGLYTIAVFLRDGSPGPFPATFQIHLSGNVGLPRKLINGEAEIERGTRLDILFNHPAPRPQILAGADSAVAQTGLFKFANPVSISPYAIAVMLPPTPYGYPVGEAVIRAADPVVLGQLRDGIVDRTAPTARTPEWTLPRIGSIIDFTQAPLPHSVAEWPPLPPLQGTILSVLWENDGLGVELPLSAVNGTAQSIILDMGFSQEIVDGEGNDFKVFAPGGSYTLAVGNTPYSTDFIPLSNMASGDQEFDLKPSGLTSARFVRIMANTSVTVDAVKSLNVFADAIRSDIGAAADMAEATILMRRMKAPETNLDPFLELIAPDGSRLGENESGFGDETSLDLSDAALIGIDLTQIGFHRFLGRGYHQVPDEQAFGSYFVRLESGGAYDKEKITISKMNEAETIAQKSGQISATQQRDSYLFEAQPGQKINIVVNALDEVLDPVVELYDPEEFLIASNDNFVNRGRNAVLSVQLPDSSFSGRDVLPNPSTYRIAVSAIHASGSFTRDEEENINVYVKQLVAGDYELKVFTGALEGPSVPSPIVNSVTPQRVKTGINNTEVKILGENFQNGAQVSFSGSGISVNNVQFLSSSQLVCSIDISSDASLGWRHITVINPDGQKNTGYALLKVVDIVGNVQLTWEPPNSSEFLAPPTNLSVAPGDGFMSSALAGQVGNTGLSARAPITEVEPNNSLEQAMVLSGELVLLNGNVEVSDVGAITPIDDDIEDLFKVTTSDPGVSLALDSFTSDCDLYLLDQDGELIFSANNREATGSEDIAIQGLANGTYYIGVSIYDPNPAGGNSTPYMLTAMGKFEGGGETPVVQKYNIYRSTVADAKTTGVVVDSVDAPVTEYLDSAPFTARFYYQISAVYEAGESEGSNEASLMVTHVENDRTRLIWGFALFQNYPNPFNPITTITYDLPEDTDVRLSIFDILGQRVKILVAKKQTAGSYTVQWDGRNENNQKALSGVYIFRIEAGNKIMARKMLLLK